MEIKFVKTKLKYLYLTETKMNHHPLPTSLCIQNYRQTCKKKSQILFKSVPKEQFVMKVDWNTPSSNPASSWWFWTGNTAYQNYPAYSFVLNSLNGSDTNYKINFENVPSNNKTQTVTFYNLLKTSTVSFIWNLYQAFCTTFYVTLPPYSNTPTVISCNYGPGN